MFVLFLKYFLPIIAISVLVNVIVFPSSMELFLMLLGKSIITTIITVVCILYGVKRERQQKKRSKIRLFCWYFWPMIPYLELFVIAYYEQNFSLFANKTGVYLLSYGILALYYTYSQELKKAGRWIRKYHARR